MSIERFLTEEITEYTVTTTKDAVGRASRSYTRRASYPARIESITAEKAKMVYGVEGNITYRMFTTVEPTLGNAVLIDGTYYTIRRVIPKKGSSSVHHYEALLEEWK